MRTSEFTVLAAFLLLSAAGSAGCSEGGAVQEQGFTKEMALAKKKVEVAPVGRVTFERGIQSTGSLEPRYEASMRALVSGPVVAVHVDIGDRVSRGEVLFETRPVESELAMQSAAAALQTARANLADLLAWQRSEEIEILRAECTRARAEYQRLAEDSRRAALVFDKGAISESALQAARTAAESAKAMLEVAEERLRVAENGPTEEQIEIARSRVAEMEAALDGARQNLADTRIRAPYSGVITGTFLKAGDYASRGDPVLKLADISFLEAETRVPERYAPSIEKGLPVVVRVDSLGVERKGEVIAVNGAIDEATRTFLVKVGIENEGHSLKAGVFCVCDFQLPPLEGALAIPHLAVQQKEGTSYVWIEESGRVHRVDVTLGARNDGYIQVLDGLDGDEKVVVAGAGALSENDEVELTDSSGIHVREGLTPERSS